MLAGACILIPGLPLRAAVLGHSLRSPCGDRAGSLALLPTRRSGEAREGTRKRRRRRGAVHGGAAGMGREVWGGERCAPGVPLRFHLGSP